MRKPFKRKRTGYWYVKDSQGREINLGTTDEEEAFRKWEAMRDAAAPLHSGSTLHSIALAYLRVRPPKTPRQRQDEVHLRNFVRFVGVATQANRLSPSIADTWLNEEKPGQTKKDGTFGKPRLWSESTKRDAYSAICRVLDWAKDEGLLKKNPIKGVKVSASDPRQSIITEEQHALIKQEAGPEFSLFLDALWLSGGRQQAVREVTARHVSQCGTYWEFAPEEHKGGHRTKKKLTIYLPPELQEITRKQIELYPSGPLFRNRRGSPWKKDTVSQKFRRIREKLGLPPGITPHAYRHTFITKGIKNGLSPYEVSQLAGHQDSRMVERVYDKSRDDVQRMQGLVQKLDGPTTEISTRISASEAMAELTSMKEFLTEEEFEAKKQEILGRI